MAGTGRKNANDALLTALATGATVHEAAKRACVSERTAFRRLSDSTFRGEVTRLRAEIVARALGKMADSMTEAADTLRQLLGAKAESVRLGAARSILELAIKLRETVEIEARLQAVERQLDENDGGQQP